MAPRRLLVICTAILVAGCGEPGPAGPPGRDPGLTDPAIAPRVLSTYPPDGATGLFQVFVPGTAAAPHFVVELNKLVERSAFRSEWFELEGFDRPVRFELFEEPGPYDSRDVLMSVLRVRIYDSVTSLAHTYEVGRTYTLVVGTALVDFTGRHLTTPQRFSYTPEPDFRVVTMQPVDADQEVSPDSPVVVRFNSPVDARILPSLRITPPMSGIWRIATDGALATTLQHPDPFAFGADYTVEVLDTATDTDGHRLRGTVRSTFQALPFKITHTGPIDGAVEVEPIASIYALASGGVDSLSAAVALHIEPPVPGEFWCGPFSFGWTPSAELQLNTVYRVTISSALRAMDGTALAVPHVYSFRTVPFRVEETSPSNWSIVEMLSDISVRCSGRIDSTSVEACFSMSPAVSGRFYFSDRSFHYRFDQPLIPNSSYTVTISTALRSQSGAPLAAPYTFTFETYSFTPVIYPRHAQPRKR